MTRLDTYFSFSGIEGDKLRVGFPHETPAAEAVQPQLLYSSAMLQETLEQGRAAADQALERLIPPATQHPVSIHKAMRHSVFAGGKRLRPILF